MSIVDALENLTYGPAPESPKRALEWLELHGRAFGCFVNGAFTDTGVQTFASRNPATGESLALVTQADEAIVDRAVAAARLAYGSWSNASGFERGRVLYGLARQIQKHSRLLAVLESLDNGKPIRETRDLDIPLAARHFYYHAGCAQLVESEFAGYGPIGVCGQIIPWNFPLMMLAWKIAPALAAGNTVVLKPAEYTSLTALLFAELCQAAGVPDGVVNVVTGDGEVGRMIVEHADVDKIAFTGSTEVGRVIRDATAGSPKKLSLELGGKSPFIVFEDADLDGAVEGLVDAIWLNQGQVCCAGSRLLVEESVEQRFLDKVRQRMETLRVGDPLDKSTDVGAIVDQAQRQRIDDLVRKGVEEGASLYQASAPCPEGGCFYLPTLLTGVDPSATVAIEEIFGPVIVEMPFRTVAEGIALANNTRYGLAASVWSQSVGQALEVAAKLKAGTVWVNCTNQFDASSGFGGYRESGYGREGGREGMYEYLKPLKSPRRLPTAAYSDPGPIKPIERIDRTHKQFIGGKQARPDSGYSIALRTRSGVQEVASGNRKDVRNAVEAARVAQPTWEALGGHGRAQVLYYVAENLAASRAGFTGSISAIGAEPEAAAAEFEAAVRHLFLFAAWADKYDGSVHRAPLRGLVYASPEPLGVLGVACPISPSFSVAVALMAAGASMGNSLVLLPSEQNPLPIAELYRVLEASDVPAGVINIVTGPHLDTLPTLAEHDEVAGLWHFGGPEYDRLVNVASCGNLKQTWVGASLGEGRELDGRLQRELLRRATQVKNVWVPYGA